MKGGNELEIKRLPAEFISWLKPFSNERIVTPAFCVVRGVWWFGGMNHRRRPARRIPIWKSQRDGLVACDSLVKH